MPKNNSLTWLPMDFDIGVPFMTQLLEKFEDKYEAFRDPVWETYPDLEKVYKSLISRPLSFREVGEAISKRIYKYYGDFLYDILTIVWNCIEFNGSGNIFYRQASSMKQELFRESNKFIGLKYPDVMHFQSVASMENDVHNFMSESKKNDPAEKMNKVSKNQTSTKPNSSKGVKIKYKYVVALQRVLDEMSDEQRDAVAVWLVEQTGIRGDPVEGALRGSKVEIQFNEHAGELLVKLLEHLQIRDEDDDEETF